MAGAAAGDRDGGDPKHGELARDETEAKTGGALLLRRLLEATNALVSSADRDEPYRDGCELDSGVRVRQWRRIVHSLLRHVNGARTGRGKGWSSPSGSHDGPWWFRSCRDVVGAEDERRRPEMWTKANGGSGAPRLHLVAPGEVADRGEARGQGQQARGRRWPWQ